MTTTEQPLHEGDKIMEIIAQSPVTGQALWPNATDEFYQRVTNKQFMIEIKCTKRGEFFVVATPRNPLAHTFTLRSGAIHNEPAAREIANDLWLFMRDNYTGSLNGPRWTHNTRDGLCPECEGIGTLVTTQQAYGDETLCSTDKCNYRHWYSIGD